MKIFSREQLEKMSTERLLNIRRQLTPTLAISYHYDLELDALLVFDQDLRAVMAQRPHVPR